MPSEVALGEGGYAKALPPDVLEKERQSLAPLVREADVVILSALVSGEVAPVLVTEEMVQGMKPGSVIIDVSIDQGGNCALTQPGGEVITRNVYVCGTANIPGSVAVDATWLYANNMFHYVENLFRKGVDTLDLDDEIVRQSLVTHEGKILHKGALKAMGDA